MSGIDWPAVRRRLSGMTEDPAWRALEGAGPLHSALLAERAEHLAHPREESLGLGRDVLVLEGADGHWGIELSLVDRVEPLAPVLPVPGRPPWLAGLSLLAGERRLLVDIDALAGNAPARAPDRPGHAVGLRGCALALAVDWVDGIANLDLPPRRVSADLVWALLPGGLVMLDGEALRARVMGEAG